MKKNLRAAFVAVVSTVAVGCGHSNPPAVAAHDEHGEHGEHKGDHPKLTGAPHAFHETLAPLWHAAKGPDREQKTCDAVPTFEQRAADVQKESGDGDVAARALVASVADLKTECAKPAGSRTDFEAKLAGVHDAFHKVVEAKR